MCTHVYSWKYIHIHNALGSVYIYGRPEFWGMYTQVNNALVCVYTSIHDALGGIYPCVHNAWGAVYTCIYCSTFLLAHLELPIRTAFCYTRSTSLLGQSTLLPQKQIPGKQLLPAGIHTSHSAPSAGCRGVFKLLQHAHLLCSSSFRVDFDERFPARFPWPAFHQPPVRFARRRAPDHALA